jgi:hypothetical protein
MRRCDRHMGAVSGGGKQDSSEGGVAVRGIEWEGGGGGVRVNKEVPR